MLTPVTHVARFWRSAENKIVCELCPHECRIDEGKSGVCGVRVNKAGVLEAAGYGHLSSAHLDPIEKKPLYHFLPGKMIFSIGGWGCNFACAFCQNWSISQERRLSGAEHSPSEIVSAASRNASMGLAYTYNEPVINFEFLMDCAALVRKAGLANVLVTNGYILRSPAVELLPLVDALNIDIKSMDDLFYRKQCRGTLRPVLDFAAQAVQQACHVEITNLLIPGLNDSPKQVKELAHWIAEQLGRFTPLHLSAYHPDYKLDLPPTSAASLLGAFAAASEELAYVYLGNINTKQGRDTICPTCGAVLVSRSGFDARIEGMTASGVCASCGRQTEMRMKQEIL